MGDSQGAGISSPRVKGGVKASNRSIERGPFTEQEREVPAFGIVRDCERPIPSRILIPEDTWHSIAAMSNLFAISVV